MLIDLQLTSFFVLLFGLFSISAINIKYEDIIHENEPEEETTLSADDFAKAPKEEIDLKLLGIETKLDPTMGNKTEGDIAVPNVREFDDRISRLGRSAVRGIYRRWPNAEIPYAISSRYGPYSRSVIAKAMQNFHDSSCVRFIPRDTDRHQDYLYILPDDGCYSLVGRAGGRQPVSLEAGCIQSGTITHELMHAVGFFHEQSRPDRDKFIEILWQNVMPGAEDQFDKHSFWILDTLNEPYDYSSIMHYGPYAFTGNGRRTIIATKPGAEQMGQRKSFSKLDIRKLNKLYFCSKKTNNTAVNENIIDDKTAVVKPDDECVDKSWKCIFVSIADYCQLDDEIANNICRKSCGNCRNQPIKKKPKINKPEEGPVTRQLPKLTSTTSIYTDRTMLITTATTITTIVNTNITVLPDKSAENTVQDCHDFDGSCAFWAENGGCSNYFLRTFMKTICLQYCEYCLDGNSYERSNKTPKTAKLCNDQASYIVCKLALLFDECDEKVNVCAETCGAC